VTFICKCCGAEHDGLPDVSFDRPLYAAQVPENERASRLQLNSDLCIVDDEHYFIRGIVEIPVHDHSDYFGIGVWVSLKPENFKIYLENFDSPEIGPFFGWLSNDFEFEGERTLNLATMAHFRGDGLRPRIELDTTDHPMAVAQREGISLDQAWVIVHNASHGSAT
jgi:hypothetical protein